MKLEFRNTPKEVLPVLKGQLEAFGARVEFETETSGKVHSIAGELHFEHSDRTLTISVAKEHGHFPQNLLIGGIKQTVAEAIEIVQMRAAHA